MERPGRVPQADLAGPTSSTSSSPTASPRLPAELYGMVHLVWNLPRRCSLAIGDLSGTKKRSGFDCKTKRSLAETELLLGATTRASGSVAMPTFDRHLVRWIVADGIGVSGPIAAGLRRHLANVIVEPVPARLAALLRNLEAEPDEGFNTGKDHGPSTAKTPDSVDCRG